MTVIKGIGIQLKVRRRLGIQSKFISQSQICDVLIIEALNRLQFAHFLAIQSKSYDRTIVFEVTARPTHVRFVSIPLIHRTLLRGSTTLSRSSTTSAK